MAGDGRRTLLLVLARWGPPAKVLPLRLPETRPWGAGRGRFHPETRRRQGFWVVLLIGTQSEAAGADPIPVHYSARRCRQ